MTKVTPELYNFIEQLSMDGTIPLAAGKTIKDAEVMALERFKIRIEQAKALLKEIGTNPPQEVPVFVCYACTTINY